MRSQVDSLSYSLDDNVYFENMLSFVDAYDLYITEYKINIKLIQV